MFMVLFPVLITLLTLGTSMKPHQICHQEVIRTYLYKKGQVVGFQDRGVRVCEGVGVTP